MRHVLFVAAALAAAAPAAAVTVFDGVLSGAQETNPNASTATGYGTITLSDDMNMIDVTLGWSGLTAPAAAGHIHCCALLGANGPVAIDLMPVPFTAGSITATFDLTMASTYAGGFFNANGATAASARTAFLTGLTGGRTYFNVHNRNFPSGEIRGQIGAVPEASTWALMIAGFGLVGTAMRRRTRVAVAA